MNQFSFVFLVMSSDHDHTVHHTMMESPLCKTLVVGVKDLADACEQAKRLADAGEIKKIELCGAFGKEGAQAVRDAVDNKDIIVSYIVNL